MNDFRKEFDKDFQEFDKDFRRISALSYFVFVLNLLIIIAILAGGTFVAYKILAFFGIL